MTVRFILGRPAEESTWASLVHDERPGEFFARFIQSVREHQGQLTDDERIALVMGLVSHEAADSTIHPLVNWCARRDARELGGEESHYHRITEKQQCLFFHVERYGDDVVGTPSTRQSTFVTKRHSWLHLSAEPAPISIVRRTFEAAYGRVPTRNDVARWIRSFGHFGLALSLPLVRRDSLRSRTAELRDRYYRNEWFDYDDYHQAACDFGVKLANLALDYYESGDFSDASRAAFLVAADLDDSITTPSARRSPPLPPEPGRPSRAPAPLAAHPAKPASLPLA